MASTASSTTRGTRHVFRVHAVVGGWRAFITSMDAARRSRGAVHGHIQRDVLWIAARRTFSRVRDDARSVAKTVAKTDAGRRRLRSSCVPRENDFRRLRSRRSRTARPSQRSGLFVRRREQKERRERCRRIASDPSAGRIRLRSRRSRTARRVVATVANTDPSRDFLRSQNDHARSRFGVLLTSQGSRRGQNN